MKSRCTPPKSLGKWSEHLGTSSHVEMAARVLGVSVVEGHHLPRGCSPAFFTTLLCVLV